MWRTPLETCSGPGWKLSLHPQLPESMRSSFLCSARRDMLVIKFWTLTMPTIFSPSATGIRVSPRPAVMRRMMAPRVSSGLATWKVRDMTPWMYPLPSTRSCSTMRWRLTMPTNCWPRTTGKSSWREWTQRCRASARVSEGERVAKSVSMTSRIWTVSTTDWKKMP